MICLPHFGDQGFNAQLIVDNEIGISLIDPKMARRQLEPDIKWEKELFTYQDVHDKMQDILTNPKYKVNIKRMQRLCKSTGGRTLAADTIENIFFTGNDHLIDLHFDN